MFTLLFLLPLGELLQFSLPVLYTGITPQDLTKEDISKIELELEVYILSISNILSITSNSHKIQHTLVSSNTSNSNSSDNSVCRASVTLDNDQLVIGDDNSRKYFNLSIELDPQRSIPTIICEQLDNRSNSNQSVSHSSDSNEEVAVMLSFYLQMDNSIDFFVPQTELIILLDRR